MANFYKKILIALIATGLFIGACSKSGGNNPTPNNPTPTNPDPNPTNTIPTITSLSVTSGGFDAVVLINGTNFSTTITNNRVFFNGNAATVSAATATQLTVKVPQDAGTGAVTISVNGGATVTGPTFTYIIPAPAELKIISLDTDKGVAGAPINITGTGFSAVLSENKVFFNGKAAEVTAATTTKLSVKVPEGAGIGKITVTVSGKTVEGPEFNYTLQVTVTTLAGNNKYTSIDGIGTSASFLNIYAITADKTGNIYVAENDGPESIRKITPDGVVTTILKFNQSSLAPLSLAVDNNNNVYYSQQGNSDIKKITPDGNLSTYVGNTNGTFIANPQLSIWSFITMDADGNLIIADNSTIKKIANSGFSTLAGGTMGAAKDANGTSATFGALSAVTTDNSGNIYVVDTSPGDSYENNPKIRKINSSKDVTTLFSFPTATSVAVASNGNIFLGNSDFKIFMRDNKNVVSQIVGFAVDGTHTDGNQFTARFTSTKRIAIDGNNNIYVADSNRIRKITLK